jgi:hypothetical protein
VKSAGIVHSKARFTMATATVKQADIEKVVHKVLEDERAENDRTVLRAIQRVSSLLTEQVIPNLPDSTEADEETGSDDEHDEEYGSGPGSKVFASRSAHADDDVGDDGNPSDDDQDDQIAEVPEQVMKAFAALYRTLSPEQAEALGAFFTAVSEELSQSDEGHEDEDEDAGADPEENPRLH